MDVVIAVYNEDIDWINQLKQKRIFVYLKNSDRLNSLKEKFPNVHFEVLENIGRESHTYIYHICNHYYDLSNFTVFLQGNPFDHCPNIIETIQTADKDTFFGKLYECDNNGDPHHSGLPVGKIYRELFGKIKLNFKFVVGAQFMVSDHTIIKIPLEKYKTIFQKHYTEPILPWCMERYWISMFT